MREPEIVRGPPDTPAPPHVARYLETGGRWSPRTYADELAERGEDPRVRVRCDCRRTRPAFAVIDFRPLPEALRGPRAWGCDCCKVTTINRRLAGDRAEFVRLLGGPAVVVERLTQPE